MAETFERPTDKNMPGYIAKIKDTPYPLVLLANVQTPNEGNEQGFYYTFFANCPFFGTHSEAEQILEYINENKALTDAVGKGGFATSRLGTTGTDQFKLFANNPIGLPHFEHIHVFGESISKDVATCFEPSRIGDPSRPDQYFARKTEKKYLFPIFKSAIAVE